MSEVKPGAGVLLNHFSIYLNNLSLITSLNDEIKEICNDGKSAMGVYYTYGASDVLVIGMSDKIEKIHEIQNMQSYKHVKGVMDFFSYYGTAISVYPAPFNLDEAATTNPIIGIISIKLRTEAWSEICNNLKNLNELKIKLEEAFNKAINKTNDDCKGLNSSNFKAILILSYGVEDGIIILYTNSFQYIKTFVANIRTLELADVIGHQENGVDFKHIIVDTFTTLGVKVNDDYKPQICILNTYDKLSWEILLKIRPGHLQFAINELLKLDPIKDKSLKPIPIIGRNDLIIQPNSALSG